MSANSIVASKTMSVNSHMYAGGSDFDGSDEYEYEDAYHTTSLRSMGQSAIKWLNLTPAYQRHWRCKEGFREVYQNW